jgi:hypothetical protein
MASFELGELAHEGSSDIGIDLAVKKDCPVGFPKLRGELRARSANAISASDFDAHQRFRNDVARSGSSAAISLPKCLARPQSHIGCGSFGRIQATLPPGHFKPGLVPTGIEPDSVADANLRDACVCEPRECLRPA